MISKELDETFLYGAVTAKQMIRHSFHHAVVGNQNGANVQIVFERDGAGSELDC